MKAHECPLLLNKCPPFFNKLIHFNFEPYTFSSFDIHQNLRCKYMPKTIKQSSRQHRVKQVITNQLPIDTCNSTND